MYLFISLFNFYICILSKLCYIFYIFLISFIFSKIMLLDQIILLCSILHISNSIRTFIKRLRLFITDTFSLNLYNLVLLIIELHRG